MKIFIICSVRGADSTYLKKLNGYAKYLEDDGHKVHLPPRNTRQDAKGIDICKQNMEAIRNADQVHVFYSPDSQGTHFDLGVAFALKKKIIVVESVQYINGKSFSRMLVEWMTEDL